MARYRYPDSHDEVPARSIRHQGAAGAWAQADHDLVRAAARRHHGGRPECALDVGTGNGRLLATIASQAGSVVAIDPDSQRIRYARAQGIPDGAGVEFVEADLVEYARRGRAADLVVCSHVLQHVRTTHRTPFVRALRAVTASTGVLLLTWSSSAQRHGRHLLSRTAAAGEPMLAREVAAGAFDGAVDNPGADELPVWHAGTGEVEQALRAAGFAIRKGGAYRCFTYDLTLATGGSPVVRSAADRYAIGTPATEQPT